MGLRGKPPKPTVIEIAEGRPGHRPLPRGEPKPAPITPEEAMTPPEHLTEGGKHWWLYYAPLLLGLKVLTEADLIALEGLATATAERIEQEVKLATAGPLYKTGTGYIIISPLFSVVDRLRDRELKLLREFGMTPASRTRVQTTGQQEKTDPIESAMCG
jgi:P27 family predicted phage terminase small subunit